MNNIIDLIDKNKLKEACDTIAWIRTQNSEAEKKLSKDFFDLCMSVASGTFNKKDLSIEKG